jgi:hypothetical protein
VRLQVGKSDRRGLVDRKAERSGRDCWKRQRLDFVLLAQAEGIAIAVSQQFVARQVHAVESPEAVDYVAIG